MKPHLVTPFVWNTQPGRWPYVLECNATVCLSGYHFTGCHLFLDRGKTIAKLDGPLLTIYERYSWNGCTGVPTPESTLLGSLVHDCLYQFGGLYCVPWDRKQADSIFHDLMQASGFPLAGVYYAGVRLFGAIHYGRHRARQACLIHGGT